MLVPRKKNEDLRNYSVLPFEAARDTRLHGTAALSVLCVLCTYTDQLGVTWVSQGKIARDMGISRTAVTRQIKKLIELNSLTEEINSTKAAREIAGIPKKKENLTASPLSQPDTRAVEIVTPDLETPGKMANA